MSNSGKANILKLKRVGIDTYQEPVAYMHQGSPVVRSEGFDAQSRVLVKSNGNSVVATLSVVVGDWLAHDEVGLSESAWAKLNAQHEGEVTVTHPRTLDSLANVRSKIFGHRLDDAQMSSIIEDVVAGRYRDVHIASFITACATGGLNHDEIASLTRAMVAVGDRLKWESEIVVDKHCIGGLPGNRTTPLVVSIVAAHGLVMPKTSSRAITSPAGTADTMECLAPVDLSISEIRRVVHQEGGCVVWGGSVQLSPTDDIFIRIERAIDVDSMGQMIASILSKKVAAGATHVVIDIPKGKTAKIRTDEDAAELSEAMCVVGTQMGLKVKTIVTDGSQPVGRGIGPALEAEDVLAVLQNEFDAPKDLKERAIQLAGAIIDMSDGESQTGIGLARAHLESGRAWAKFQAICEAQGGMRIPPKAPYSRPICAPMSGIVAEIDNRRISNTAKLAGAPVARAAGVRLLTPLGTRVQAGQPLFEVLAETPGELSYAMEYLAHHPQVVRLEEK